MAAEISAQVRGVRLTASLNAREQRAWYVYDFANSAFASTVITLFLGPYLTSLAKAAAGADGRVHPFGIPVEPRSWWGYMVALSVLTQVLALPLMGTIADFSPNKKRLLALCAYTGAAATVAMFTLEGSSYLLGGFLFLVANLAFGASIVVYNSFLPEISEPEERDNVSSKGWGFGYLGGGIVLALNLALFRMPQSSGCLKDLAVRISLASAGLWWGLFTLVPLFGLKNRPPARKRAPGESLSNGFKQLVRTLRDMRQYPQTLTFLIAYLIYNDAVQAVITLSGQFGSDELKIPMGTLTMAILMVQFLAFAGSAFVQLDFEKSRNEASDRYQPDDLDGCDSRDLCDCPHDRRVLRDGCSGRNCSGWYAGAQPVLVLADDPCRPGGRILQPVRDQRQGHELDGAVDLRACASIYRQLSNRDSVATRVLHSGPSDFVTR